MKEERSSLKVKLLLERVVDALNLVSLKLDSLIELNKEILKAQKKPLRVYPDKNPVDMAFGLEPDPMTLLSLPMSLRKTVMALYKLEKATAEDIAKETHRLRAVESASANQLVRMGHLRKKREGREVYFYIEPSLEIRK